MRKASLQSEIQGPCSDLEIAKGVVDCPLFIHGASLVHRFGAGLSTLQPIPAGSPPLHFSRRAGYRAVGEKALLSQHAEEKVSEL